MPVEKIFAAKVPAEDVTPKFDLHAFPTPGLKEFISADEVMQGAEETSYLGRLTESESKKLRKKYVSVTPGTDQLLEEIAHDSRFGYRSVNDVIRHFVEMGLQYYVNHKAFLSKHGNYATDILRQQAELRLDAERIRIRQEFQENMKLFEQELDTARIAGDFPYIAAKLDKWQQMLATAETETQKRLIREILLGSIATAAAVTAFYHWTHAQHRAVTDKWEDSWVELSEDWFGFYEEK